MSVSDDVTRLLTQCLKKHTKQRKAEERSARAFYNREYVYSDRVNFTDVARRILPPAYQHASGGGIYPVSYRQLYYAAREEFRKATGREITYERFKTVVVGFINTTPKLTDEWRLTADPRGTLLIPNTFKETRVPCGTAEIDHHLDDIQHDPDTGPQFVPEQWPSTAPGQRYRAVLYIEKEGFEPLMRQARIAERFEIAVLSCKGHSVVAARKFVDHVCRVNGGVPLFIVHDLDVFGFCIGARLTSVSLEAEEQNRVAYRFANDIDATDLGLRLVDAQRYGLADEKCKRPNKGLPGDLGCTDEEETFLLSGRRIELNAFTAPQFIEWLEGKLRDNGITERMLPADAVLEQAYRRAIVTARTNAAVEAIHAEAVEEAEAAKLPPKLTQKVREAMARHDEPWDIALHRIVSGRLKISRRPATGSNRGTGAVPVATAQHQFGLSPQVLKQSSKLAKYSEAEFDAVIAELRTRGEEFTTDDVLAQLKRNRRKRS